jgi:Carboxypeptidase regulatory-like domain
MQTRAIPALLATLWLPIDVSAQAVGAAGPAAEGAAVIRGVVTDLPSGQPIARAVVKLDFLGPGVQKREAVTDDMGNYVFAALPPGSYALIAEPEPSTTTHVSRRFGQSARFDPLRHGSLVRSIKVSSGGNFTANIDLPRALTVSGRVVWP